MFYHFSPTWWAIHIAGAAVIYMLGKASGRQEASRPMAPTPGNVRG